MQLRVGGGIEESKAVATVSDGGAKAVILDDTPCLDNYHATDAKQRGRPMRNYNDGSARQNTP